MFRTDRARLAVVAAAGLVCGLLLIAPGLPAAVTFPAVALLVLVLPGYAVMRALFGRPVEPVEQATLTVGLSLALTIVGGLLLNLTPVGLTLAQWGGLLGGISVVGASLALLRGGWPARAAALPIAASDGEGTKDGKAPAGRIPRAQLAMLGIAGCILLASLGVARLGAAVEPHEPFTQLWMVPNITGTALDLGFTNDENKPTTYRLLVIEEGQTIGEWTNVTLADQATWSQVLALNFRDVRVITATLYRAGHAEPYREAHAEVHYRPNAGRTPLPSGAPTPIAPSPAGPTPIAPSPAGPTPAAPSANPIP